MHAAVEALWEHLIVERSVLTAGEIHQLRNARAAAQAQGTPLTLERQLHSVLGPQLESFRKELRNRARACTRCQTPFLASPPQGACPSCGTPGSSFQALSSSGVLAPPRSHVDSSGYGMPAPTPQAYGANPQGSGAYPIQGSGAYPVQGSGAYPVQGSGAYPVQGSGAYPAPSGAFPSGTPGSGSYPPGSGAYPPHLHNSLLNSRGFRSTASRSRPNSGSKGGGGGGPGNGSGLQTGDQVGAYVVVEELGRGGMGAVYKVQNQFGQIQALKVLHSLSGSKQARFRTEIEIMAKLCHPNVIQVHDSGTVGEFPYYVMDYVEGSDLKELIKQSALTQRESIALLVQVIRAVGYAHTCGILHRDLKPGNIIVDQGMTRPYVLDFGLAKIVNSEGNLTRTGSALGTPYYMPPELAAGRHDEVDGRADVYSLGVILYELMAGTPPFTAATTNELMRKIAKERPASLRSQGVPAMVDKVAMRALAKNPAKRYPTAEAMASDLEEWLHEPEPTVPMAVKIAAGVMAVVVLVLAVTLISMLNEDEQPSPPPEDTTPEEPVEPPQPPPQDPPPLDPGPDPLEPAPPPPLKDPPPTPPPPPPPPQPVVRTEPPARVGLRDDPLKPLPTVIADSKVNTPLKASTNIHLHLGPDETGIAFQLEVPAGAGALYVRVRGAHEDVDLYLRKGGDMLRDPRQADLVARSHARDEHLLWDESGPLDLDPGPYTLVMHRPRPRGEDTRLTFWIRFMKPAATLRPLVGIRGLPFEVKGEQPALVKCLDSYDADPEEALSAFPRLAADVDPRLGVIPALWLLDLERFDEARAAATAVLAHASQDPRALYVIACCDYAAGEYETARKQAETLIRAHPDLYEPVLLLVHCLRALGEHKTAAQLGMAGVKRDASRLALAGVALLAATDDGLEQGWTTFTQKWLKEGNLDVTSAVVGIRALLARGEPAVASEWFESRRTSWGQNVGQPNALTLLEVETLLALDRTDDARELLTALAPKLRLAEHRAQLEALRARLQAPPEDGGEDAPPEDGGR